MYFCYQSENAYIFYVIVFDKQVTLYSRLFVFFVWWVMSALSALWTDSRIRLWFFIIRLLFIHAFTLYRALLQLIEATNIARCSWTAGGRQSTKSERPSRALACLTERVIWTLQPGYRCHSCVSPWYVYPHTHIPSDMCIPGGDTINTDAHPRHNKEISSLAK